VDSTVTRGSAAGHSETATVLELPRSDLRSPILSWGGRTERSKQVEERKPTSKMTSPKSGPELHRDNTHWTEVSVYTVVGVDNMRRLQSAFSQLFLGHVDRSPEICRRPVQRPARSTTNEIISVSARHVKLEIPRLRRASFFFCPPCQVMLTTRPSMYLESPCNDF